MYIVSNQETGEVIARIRQPHERLRVRTEIVGESRTTQQFKDLTDVNNIINRFDRTGLLTHTRESQGVFADVTGLQVDLTEAINQSRQVIADAKENDSRLAKQSEGKEKERIAAEAKELAELRALKLKEKDSQQPDQ